MGGSAHVCCLCNSDLPHARYVEGNSGSVRVQTSRAFPQKPVTSIHEASMFAHRARHSLIVLTCALATLSGVPLRGQDEGPLTVVRLDLNTRIARGTLPFKEDFYLAGPAPAGSQRVEVRTREGSSDDKCRPDTGWTTAQSWLRGEIADTFYAYITELQPNRHYSICVTSLVRPVGEALAAFRRQAATLFDQWLQDLPPDNSLPNPFPPNRMRNLQSGYVRLLSKASGREVISLKSGGLLDTTSIVRASAVNELDDILRHQSQRGDRIDAFEREVRRIGAPKGKAIWDVVGHPRMGSFTDGVGAEPSPAGISKASFELAMSTALYLGSAKPSAAQALVSGEVRADPVAPRRAGLPPVELRDAWVASDLEDRWENLDASVQGIRALAVTVAAVQSSDSLLMKAGWTAASARAASEGLAALLNHLDRQQATLAALRYALRERSRLIEGAVESLSSEAQREVSLAGSSVIGYQARAKSMVSADVGLVAVHGIGVVPYLGANFYFEPVNTKVPLGIRGRAGDRLSVTLGVTARSLQRTGDRDNLFGDFGLLAGVGYRFTDPLRISSGVVVLRDESDDPLRTDKPIRVAPFVSLSLDWDVRSTLGNIADKLF
jgi:hypothetical protein